MAGGTDEIKIILIVISDCYFRDFLLKPLDPFGSEKK